jgi:hypothetical protein
VNALNKLGFFRVALPSSVGFSLELGFKLGNSLKYPGFSYENLGRFVCVELKKTFLGAIS